MFEINIANQGNRLLFFKRARKSQGCNLKPMNEGPRRLGRKGGQSPHFSATAKIQARDPGPNLINEHSLVHMAGGSRLAAPTTGMVRLALAPVQSAF